MPADKHKPITKTLVMGVAAAGLYFLLYLFSDAILAWSKQGRWFFIVPIVIAFTFSLVHGSFTGNFWDLLGVKAKPVKR